MHAPAHRPTRSLTLFLLPVVLLIAAAVLSNVGVSLTPDARAASTDAVAVDATVGAALSVADQCSGQMNITVLLGGHADATCGIQFGSTNDAAVTLQAGSAAGTFLTPAGFADEGTTCANLTVDEVGMKIVSVGAGVTKAAAWTCANGAAGVNTGNVYRGVPTAFMNICVSSALGITNTCTVGIGVFETGSNATPNTYTGQLDLNVIA